MVKNLPASAGDIKVWVQSLGQEDLLEEGMVRIQVLLPWKLFRQKSLQGYSSWGHQELDTTEVT